VIRAAIPPVETGLLTQGFFVLVTDQKPRARTTSVEIQSQINHKEKAQCCNAQSISHLRWNQLDASSLSDQPR
jgi:hypothetical protein